MNGIVLGVAILAASTGVSPTAVSDYGVVCRAWPEAHRRRRRGGVHTCDHLEQQSAENNAFSFVSRLEQFGPGILDPPERLQLLESCPHASDRGRDQTQTLALFLCERLNLVRLEAAYHSIDDKGVRISNIAA